MTATTTRLLHCRCGAAVLELERHAGGQETALIMTKNHGIMRVEYQRIEAVCHRCKGKFLLAEGLTIGVS